jgi:hypothetical protein
MAKIDRKYQKIFCGDVTAPDNIPEFGSIKEGNVQWSTDPDDIQSRLAYDNGMLSALSQNVYPFIQDFNALYYLVTRQLAYILQEGISEWLATIEYHIGSLVRSPIGNIYVSLTNDNLNHDISTEGQWMPLLSKTYRSLDAGYGSSYAVATTDWFIVHYAATGQRSIVLPTASANNTGRELIIKCWDTNTNVLSVSGNINGTTGAWGIDYSESVRLRSSGATWLRV